MALSGSQQNSQHSSTASSSTLPSLADAYTKLSSVSRNNLFRIIGKQLLLLYTLHFILHGLMFHDLTSNLVTGLLFISFIFIVLQHSITDIIHHINGAFLGIFMILLFSNGNYSHRIGLYLPQLSLITTNNKHFALFLQSLLILVAMLFGFEKFTKNEVYSSTLLIGALIVILHVLSKIDLKNENLKAEADSLNAQLKSTQNKLQDSYNFNRDFHLTISHEFRNPLNNVMGNIELVQKNLPPGDSNFEHMKMAKLGCEILLNSLNNTLDYCKIEFDEIDINYVSVNLRKCLEKSWAVFSEILRLRGLQGELYLHANVPPMVMMDPGRLHQVLLNLIHNSSKFTPKGFVKIIVSWHPCFIPNNEDTNSSRFQSQEQIPYRLPGSPPVGHSNGKRTSTPDMARMKRSADLSWVEDEFSEFPCSSQKITFSPSMNYNKLDMQTKKFPRLMKRTMPDLATEAIGFLKVQVIDSGVGIHKSNLPKVFQKFSKFSHDSIPRVEGSGLGLWVTKKICHKMEGTIHVESDLSKGSTFIVFLKCEISPQSMGTPTPSPCLSGRRSGIQTMGSLPFLGMKARVEDSQKTQSSKTEEQLKLRAMVVDDIPYNQHLNKQFLELCGVEVKYIAGNGQEAYKNYVASEKEPLDLIFMDLDMPVMDGKTSSAKIREWEKKNKLKPVVIVILTGNCSENELKLCLDKTGSIKADYFYRKPLPLPDCQNLIQQIKREKTKKKNLLMSLPKMADQVLIYEKDLFQQVLLENYLRVGQIKYHVANKDTVYEKFTKFADSICAILYNCESSQDILDTRRFVMNAHDFMKKKGKKEIPILGIVKELDREEMARLKQIGFTDFLIKPFDFENIVKLLRTHTMNGLFV